MASYAEMVAADKLAAKKKILAKRAKEKILKEQADKKRANEFKGTVPTSDKVTVTKKNNTTKKSRERGPKVIVRQGTPDQKKGTQLQKAIEKKTIKKEVNKKDKKPQPSTMPQSVKDRRAKNNKTKTAASASNTKDFEKTKKIQKELIDMGADIKADGIMGAKTRAAMAKYKAKPKKVSEMTTKEVKERGTYNLKTGGKGTYKQRQNEIRREKETDQIKKALKMKK